MNVIAFLRNVTGRPACPVAEDAPLPVAAGATVSNGTTVHRKLSANSDNATVVKVGATTLYALPCWMEAADGDVAYIKVYDKATTPTAADTPVLVIGLWSHGGPNDNSMGPVGFPLVNGLAYRIVTGFADNDATAPATGVISASFVYK